MPGFKLVRSFLKKWKKPNILKAYKNISTQTTNEDKNGDNKSQFKSVAVQTTAKIVKKKVYLEMLAAECEEGIWKIRYLELQAMHEEYQKKMAQITLDLDEVYMRQIQKLEEAATKMDGV